MYRRRPTIPIHARQSVPARLDNAEFPPERQRDHGKEKQQQERHEGQEVTSTDLPPVSIRTTYRLNTLKALPKRVKPEPGVAAATQQAGEEESQKPRSPARGTSRRGRRKRRKGKGARAVGGGGGEDEGPDAARMKPLGTTGIEGTMALSGLDRAGAPPPGESFDPIVVQVVAADGSSRECSIGELSRRIEDVKDEVYDAVFLLTNPTRNHKLVWDGKVLDETKLLDEYGISSGDTIRVVEDVVHEPKMQPLGSIQGVDIFQCCSWPEQQSLYVMVKRPGGDGMAWYWSRVLSEEKRKIPNGSGRGGKGFTMATVMKLRFFGLGDAHDVEVRTPSDSVMRLAVTKRSLATGDGDMDHWGRWQDRSLEAIGQEWRGDPALRTGEMLQLASREKGHFFKAGDCVRVHAMNADEFVEGFEDLQLLPVGRVLRAVPECDLTVVEMLHLRSTYTCFLPSAQLELVPPSVYACAEADILSVRERHRSFMAAMARRRHPQVVVNWQGGYIGGQHVLLRVVDHGTELIVHAQSIEHRRDYAFTFGAMELRELGTKPLPAPILPKAATFEWLPPAQRNKIVRSVLLYLHVECGSLCVDLKACKEHGVQREPLWHGGRYVEVRDMAAAVQAAFAQHDRELASRGSFSSSNSLKREQQFQAKSMFAHAVARMRRSQQQSRRVLIGAREEHAPEFRRAREDLAGDTSVLVLTAHDPLSRERATLALGTSTWSHLGYGALHELSKKEKMALAGALVHAVELQLPDPAPDAAVQASRGGEVRPPSRADELVLSRASSRGSSRQSRRDRDPSRSSHQLSRPASQANLLARPGSQSSAVALQRRLAPLRPSSVPGRLAVAAKTAQAVVAFGGAGGDPGTDAAGTGEDADLLGYAGPPRPPAPDPEVPEPGGAVDEHHHLLAAHEAKRFNLHQPQLPGERRADGEDAHRHLRMTMPKLQPMRRGPRPLVIPLWRGTVVACERRLMVSMFPMGGGVALQAFDRCGGRSFELKVPAREFAWMGHGPLPWLSHAERAALCWKLVRRLNVENAQLCIDLEPLGKWWLGIGSPAPPTVLWRGGVRYHRQCFLVTVTPSLLVGAPDRTREFNEKDTPAMRAQERPWGTAPEKVLLDSGAGPNAGTNVNSVVATSAGSPSRKRRRSCVPADGGDGSRASCGLQRKPWQPIRLATSRSRPIATSGRSDVLFACKLFDTSRCVAFNVAIAHGAKGASFDMSARSFGYGPYEWLDSAEKVKLGEFVAHLAALKKEQQRAAAFLKARADRALVFCAKKYDAEQWLMWRGRRARAFVIRKAQELAWLRAFGQKVARNHNRLEEAIRFLKRLRAHLRVRAAAQRFLQQCGAHALDWTGGIDSETGHGVLRPDLPLGHSLLWFGARWGGAWEVEDARPRLLLGAADDPPCATGMPLLTACGAALVQPAPSFAPDPLSPCAGGHMASRFGTVDLPFNRREHFAGNVARAVHVTTAMHAALRWLRRRTERALRHARAQDRAGAFLLGYGLKVVRTIMSRHQTRRMLLLDGCNAVRLCMARGVTATVINFAVEARRAFVVNHRMGQRAACAFLTVRASRAIALAAARDEAQLYLRRVGQEALLYATMRVHSATVVQTHARGHQARARVYELISQRWEHRTDPETKEPFFYDLRAKVSSWHPPLLLRGRPLLTWHGLRRRLLRRQNSSLYHRLPPVGMEAAVIRLQCMARARIARKGLVKALGERWQKVWDKAMERFYYFNVLTGEALWTKSDLFWKHLGDVDLEETPLWEKRWFVVTRGTMTQYLTRFESGEEETEIVERFPLRRVKRVILQKDGEFTLVTKYKEHMYRAGTVENQAQWAESIAKYLDLQITQTTRLVLRVRLIQAEGLLNKDVFGKSDPYGVVQVFPFSVGKGQSHRSKTIKNTLQPRWDEEFIFYMTGNVRGEGSVRVDLFDHDLIGKDDPLGHVVCPLAKMDIGEFKDVTLWANVEGGKGRVQINLCLIGEEEQDGGGDMLPPDDSGDSDDDNAKLSLSARLFKWPSAPPWARNKLKLK